VPPDFRLQFRAKNLMTNGVEIMLWDNATALTSSYSVVSNGTTYPFAYIDFGHRMFDVNLQSNPSVYYGALYTEPYYQYTCTNYGWYCSNINSISSVGYGGDYTPLLFNGEWMYYRIDAYGQNLKISYSQDGSTFTPVTWQVSSYDYMTNISTSVQQNGFTNMMPRDSARAYKLILGVSQPIHLDDIQLSKLDSSGNVIGVPVMTENFDNNILSPGTSSNPGISNLVTRLTYSNGTLPTAPAGDTINGWLPYWDQPTGY